MAIYLSNGSSAETDWKLGSGCTVTTYYYQGTSFSERYAPPSDTGDDHADLGENFMENGTKINTLIGDSDYAVET